MSMNMFLMNHHELSMCSSQDTRGSTQPQRTLTAPAQEEQSSHPRDVDSAGSRQSTSCGSKQIW